jgi:inner membrane transporter RhtA
MNVCFYLAISMLPLGTVGAIEFIGPIVLAAIGIHTRRNIAAVILAAAGGWLLTQVQLSGQPLGLLFAFANCGLFVLYVILGHRIAQNTETSSIDRLGAAMLIALVVVSPVGFLDATTAFAQLELLLAGVGVGICSSVIPYELDQLAMARLPRATFALLLALLPAFATMTGVLVLGQVPTVTELAGIGMIIGGVAVHQEGE